MKRVETRPPKPSLDDVVRVNLNFARSITQIRPGNFAVDAHYFRCGKPSGARRVQHQAKAQTDGAVRRASSGVHLSPPARSRRCAWVTVRNAGALPLAVQELKCQVGTRWLRHVFRGDPNAGVVFILGLNAFGEFAAQLLVFEFCARRHGNPGGSQAFASFIGIGRKNGRPQLAPAL
jgi:hypothetical protein